MAMPKALAHYWRTHGRGHKRKSRTRALTVRAPAPVVVRVPTSIAKHKRKHRRGSRGGGVSLGTISRNRKAWLAAHGALIGYTEDVKKLELWDKVPAVGKVPKELVVAALLEAFGLTRRHVQVDNFATSAAVVGGFKLGQANFVFSGEEE